MLAPVPPLVDLPGHLARIDILTRIGRSSFIASHWSADQWFVANLLFDAATLALATVLPVVAAAKVYLALAMALTMSGCIALHRAHHGRWSLWPLASVLLLYNWPLLFGLMGYVGGIGLMLWGAALLRLMERRPPWQRWLVAALTGLVCLGAHAIAFLLFAAVLGGTALTRLLDPAVARRDRLREAVAMGSALIPAGLVLVATATGGMAAAGTPTYVAAVKLAAPVMALTAGDPAGDAIALVLLLLAGPAAFWALRFRLALGLLLPLAAGVALFLALPFEHAGVTHLDTRVPAALAFLVLAAVDVERRPDRNVAPLVACFVGLLAVRVGAMAAQTVRFGALERGYERAFRQLPPGASLFSARHKWRPAGDEPCCAYMAGPTLASQADYFLRLHLERDLYVERLHRPLHIVDLASLGRDTFVSSVFSQPGVQPIEVAAAFAAYKALQEDDPIAVATGQDLAGLVQAIGSLPRGDDGPRFLLLQDDAPESLPLPPGVEETTAGPGFRLLRLTRAAPAAPDR